MKYCFFFSRTPTTMFYFSFISRLRTALIFKVLKTLKQLRNSETIYFMVSFISHVRASEIKLLYLSFILCCVNRSRRSVKSVKKLVFRLR